MAVLDGDAVAMLVRVCVHSTLLLLLIVQDLIWGVEAGKVPSFVSKVKRDAQNTDTKPIRVMCTSICGQNANNYLGI